MSKYLFGKAFTFTFYPVNADGAPVVDVNGSPTIYVYSDKPTRDEAQNGTGSPVETISSWTQDGNGFDISVSAISDPYPDSDTNEYEYWIAINYALESGGDTQTVIRAFMVHRVQGHDASLEVEKDDLEVFFSGIDGYLSETKQVALLVEAKEEIKVELQAAGFEWAKVRRPDRLRSALIAKTLALFALSEIADGTEGFDTFYREQQDRYTRLINSISLEYDHDKDGAEDSEPVRKSYTALVRR